MFWPFCYTITPVKAHYNEDWNGFRQITNFFFFLLFTHLLMTGIICQFFCQSCQKNLLMAHSFRILKEMNSWTDMKSIRLIIMSQQWKNKFSDWHDYKMSFWPTLPAKQSRYWKLLQIYHQPWDSNQCHQIKVNHTADSKHWRQTGHIHHSAVRGLSLFTPVPSVQASNQLASLI